MAKSRRTRTTARNQAATEAVLGSVLIQPNCYAEIELVPEDFDLDYQRLIFDAMRGMVNRKEPIDVLTLANELEKAAPSDTVDLPDGQPNWTATLATIQRDTPTHKNVAAYAKIVREQSLARKAVKIGSSLAELVHDDPGQIDAAMKELMGLRTLERNYSMRLGDGTSRFIDELDDRCAGKKVIGLPTGLTKLDGLLGGLAPGQLIVVGARPGMGKSTFGLQLPLHNAKVSSGFISAEMATHELVGRAVSVLSGVNSHAMRLGKVHSDDDWKRIADATGAISHMPIYVNDKPAPTADEVLRQARRWKHEHNIQMLVIDYIQRIKSIDRRRDRREELAEAVVSFKEIGRELTIPVVLLAQINRDVEKRSDKRPTLSDFKETGALEEEGDVVITLFRNEVYEPKNPDTKGEIEIAVVKHRHGPTGWFKAKYNGGCLRIENIDAAATDAFD